MAARFPRGMQPNFPVHCIGTRKWSCYKSISKQPFWGSKKTTSVSESSSWLERVLSAHCAVHAWSEIFQTSEWQWAKFLNATLDSLSRFFAAALLGQAGWCEVPALMYGGNSLHALLFFQASAPQQVLCKETYCLASCCVGDACCYCAFSQISRHSKTQVHCRTRSHFIHTGSRLTYWFLWSFIDHRCLFPLSAVTVDSSFLLSHWLSLLNKNTF